MLTNSPLGNRILQWVKIEGMLCKLLLSSSEGRLLVRQAHHPELVEGQVDHGISLPHLTVDVEVDPPGRTEAMPQIWATVSRAMTPWVYE